MKKFEIIIREVNVDGDFKPLEYKSCIDYVFLGEDCPNRTLEHCLNIKMKKLIPFFLSERNNIPFTSVKRSDHEN